MERSGQMVKVYVTHVLDPHAFWAQIGTEETLQAFTQLEDQTQDFCEQQLAQNAQSTDDLVIGQSVLAKTSSGKWRRSLITGLCDDEVDVLAVDYQSTEFIPRDAVITVIPGGISAWPPQSRKCSLYGVKPIASTWISRAAVAFSDQVLHEVVDGQIIRIDQQECHFLDLFIEDNNNDITPLSDLLIADGLAVPTAESPPPAVENGTHKVPEFNLSVLSQQVVRKKSDDDDGANIERALFLKEIGHEEGSPPNNDPRSGPLVMRPGIKKFGSIKDQLMEAKGRSQSPADNVGKKPSDSSPARSPPEAKSARSPARSRQHNKDARRGKGRGRGMTSREGQRSNTQPGVGNKASPAAQRKYDKQKPPQPNSPGRPHHSQDRVQKHDQFHSHDRVQKHDQAQSHDRVHQSHDRVHQSHDRVHQSHDRVHQSHDRVHKHEPSAPASSHRPPSPARHKQHSAPPQKPTLAQAVGSMGHSQPMTVAPKESSGIGITVYNKPTPSGPSKEEEQQNEYDWHAFQLQTKLKKLLKSYEETLDLTSLIHDTQDLVFPAKSVLESLPGPKELHLCFDVILDCVTEDPRMHSTAVYLIQSCVSAGHPEFNETINKCLKHHHNNVTKEAGVSQRNNFCKFLGELFCKSLDWQQGSNPIIDCISAIVAKWNNQISPSYKGTASVSMETYVGCLATFLTETGVLFQEALPSKANVVMTTIKDSLYSPRVNRETKDTLLKVLFFMQQGAQPPPPRPEPAPVPVPPAPDTVTQATQTHVVVLTESAIQVDLLPPPPPPEVKPDPDVVAYDPDDPFRKVKVMLKAKHIEDQFEIFEESAIMDDLLDLDYEDLKPLLRECGVKLGHCKLIETYLRHHESRLALEEAMLGPQPSSVQNRHRARTQQQQPQHQQLLQERENLQQRLEQDHQLLKQPTEQQHAPASHEAAPKEIETYNLFTPQDFISNGIRYPDPSYVLPDVFYDAKNTSAAASASPTSAKNVEDKYFPSRSDVDNWRKVTETPQDDQHQEHSPPKLLERADSHEPVHPCEKYQLKSIKGVVLNHLSSGKTPAKPSQRGRTPSHDQTNEELESEDPYQESITPQKAWTEPLQKLMPPMNLRPDEYPTLETSPETTLSDSHSPPTPRTYLPPAPPPMANSIPPTDLLIATGPVVQPEPVMPSEPVIPSEPVVMSEPVRNIPGFQEAVDMSQNVFRSNNGMSLARPTQKAAISTSFGKNRRCCTACGAIDHNIDDCPRKDLLFLR